MNKMIRRVEAALGSFWVSQWEGTENWTWWVVHHRDSGRTDAFSEHEKALAHCRMLNTRAAIEAMREPTENMLAAALALGDDYHYAAPEKVWRAMIDAALKP